MNDEALSLLAKLRLDLKAHYPEVRSNFQLLAGICLNPGFHTVFLYRLANHFGSHGVLGGIVARLIYRFSILMTSCHIHFEATIGPGLYLPHPAGIVIGTGAVIGKNVTIYQHVTVGVADLSSAQYPHIESGVTIFSGAVIAGGIHLGGSSIIGANAVVLHDVPNRCVAVGVPAKVIRKSE